MERKYPQLSTNLIFTDLEPKLVKRLHELHVNNIQDLMEHIYEFNNDISLNDFDLELINDFFRRHFKEILQENTSLSFHFRIINNHIIVDCSNGEYLLDTGSPLSYTFDLHQTGVEIDRIIYPLTYMPDFNLEKIYQTIGSEIKGIIGLDILNRTNFTLIKRDESGGDIYFSFQPRFGRKWPLKPGIRLRMNVTINGLDAVYLVDTGANISYIRHNFVRKANPLIKEVSDYNPNLGELKSNLYKVNVKIDKNYELDVAVNKRVEEYALESTNSDLIGGVLPLFKSSIAFNISERWVAIN